MTKFLLMALILISIKAMPQKQDDAIIMIENQKIIFIETTGKITLNSSNAENVKVNSLLTTKGEIVGYKSPNQRPQFIIKSRFTQDTLFIKIPEKYNPRVIGVNTYQETIESIVSVPDGYTVVINNPEKANIKEVNNDIYVLNSKETFCKVNSNNIETLNCIATNNLLINGIESNKQFKMKGIGKNYIEIESENIILNIQNL